MNRSHNELRIIVSTLFLGGCAIFIESIFPQLFGRLVPAPQLGVALVVFISFYRPSVFGAILVFCLGIEYDLFSSTMLLGPHAAAFVVVFGIVSSLSQRLFLESFVTIALAVLLSAMISELVYYLVVSQFIETQKNFLATISSGGADGVLAALLAPMLFKMFRSFSVGQTSSTQREFSWVGNRSR